MEALLPFRMVVTFVVASLVLAESAAAQPAPPTVSTAGVATEEARPDTAFVTLEILDQRPTAGGAESENARLAGIVLDSLKSSNIEAKDIATAGLSLFPVWNDERDPKTGQTLKRALAGYQASNTLSVRVRAIAKTGALIAQAVQDGATYQGVAFDLSDRDAREDALRAKAVANAMHRAALYAEGAQMKLGPLLSISAEAGQPYRVAGLSAPRTLAMAPAASPMPVEPGLVTLSQSVTAVWALAPR
jgi:hypothetical protein